MYKTCFTFFNHKVVFENLNAFQQHIGAVSNHLLPVFLRGSGFRTTHESEVLRLEVGGNVEAIAEVIDAVFEVAFTWLYHLEVAHGRIGTQHTVFVAQCLVGTNHHVFLTLRFVNEA